MRWKVTGWLAVLAVLLTGCLTKPQQSSPPAGAEGPVAEAKVEGTGVRFTLKGHSGTDLPALKVVSVDGFDWSAKVDKPAREGDVVTAKLPGERGLAPLAVEQLAYTWTLPGGKTVVGEIQFRDARFPDMAWQVTRTDNLLIYHVKALKAQDTESWEKALEQVMAWTGAKLEKPLVMWVFPDYETLNTWSRLDRVGGLWLEDVGRLMIFDDADTTERLVIMLHEMVHAMSPGHGPSWFEEGSAQLFESRFEKAVAGQGATRWAYKRSHLKAIQDLARQQQLEPSMVTARSQPPLDSYTVGVSIWLFVKHHHGEAGVQRFFAEGGEENGVKPVLEDLFQELLPEVWDDWNAYLRSPDLLEDWETP